MSESMKPDVANPLDRAFEALKSYDWGQDPSPLKPIEDALPASHADASLRRELEARLSALLRAEVPRAARDFACRKLSRIGTADSVPALAALLRDDSLSHLARYALEQMPCPEAAKALRDAVPEVKGKIRVGAINSLGARRDVESTALLTALLGDSEPEAAGAAAAALGEIGTVDAGKALRSFQKRRLEEKGTEELRPVVADACLVCAERLVATGNADAAREIYEALRSSQEAECVREAAARGLSALASSAGACKP